MLMEASDASHQLCLPRVGRGAGGGFEGVGSGFKEFFLNICDVKES
jgi:hypothetical protein